MREAKASLIGQRMWCFLHFSTYSFFFSPRCCFFFAASAPLLSATQCNRIRSASPYLLEPSSAAVVPSGNSHGCISSTTASAPLTSGGAAVRRLSPAKPASNPSYLYLWLFQDCWPHDSQLDCSGRRHRQ